jgi:hypothetical protein
MFTLASLAGTGIAARQVLVLTLCASALVACKSGEQSRRAFGTELAGKLDSSCTSEAGDKGYKTLFVFCQKGDKADELAAAAQQTVEGQCSKLAELRFTKAQVAGATTAVIADVKGGTCAFSPNPTM